MSEWATAAETDADEKALLAQVMALSQQEFLDSLKHCSKEDQNSTENGTEQAGSSKTSWNTQLLLYPSRQVDITRGFRF